MERCKHGLMRITCAICMGLSTGAKPVGSAKGRFGMHSIKVDVFAIRDPALEGREIGEPITKGYFKRKDNA